MPSAAASILAVASMLPVPLSVLLCCEFVTNIHLLSTTAPGASTCSTCTTTPGTPYAPCRGASTGSTSPTVCSLSSGSSSGAPPAEARGRAASRLRLRFLHTGNLAYQISTASANCLRQNMSSLQAKVFVLSRLNCTCLAPCGSASGSLNAAEYISHLW